MEIKVESIENNNIFKNDNISQDEIDGVVEQLLMVKFSLLMIFFLIFFQLFFIFAGPS